MAIGNVKPNAAVPAAASTTSVSWGAYATEESASPANNANPGETAVPDVVEEQHPPVDGIEDGLQLFLLERLALREAGGR